MEDSWLIVTREKSETPGKKLIDGIDLYLNK